MPIQSKNNAMLVIIACAFLLACKKEVKTGIMNTGNFTQTDTTSPLKSATDIPIGAAISYTPMINDAKYSAIVNRDFSNVTPENEMKHGNVVKTDGSLDFSKVDALVSAASGLQVLGHPLGWYQQQNATYLKNYAGITLPAATELLTNEGFESGLSGWATYNSGNPSGSATVTTGSGSNEVRTGIGSMKVVNPIAYPGSQWRVQVASPMVNTIVGTQYVISYWVKAATSGGSIRLSTATSGGGSAQYQGDQTIGTNWQQVTWTITANSPQTRFLFDMGQVANTYSIDDASFKEVKTAPSGTQVIAKLDTALGNFITAMVSRYKNKVRAWDVVNELFADDGSIRTNNNLPSGTSASSPGIFVWSNYMGRDFALKAFNYAKAADPTAEFFINEYGIESNTKKLDSLIAFVSELKNKGAKVDGIGTQMHVAWNTPYNGIDQMFQKLGATGLKIRVSELDVKVINGSAAASTGNATAQLLGYQAAMLKYIVGSYLKYVPKAQQAGITVWGVTDKYSWLYNNGKEYPLLYDVNYNKKPAYAAFLQALRNQ